MLAAACAWWNCGAYAEPQSDPAERFTHGNGSGPSRLRPKVAAETAAEAEAAALVGLTRRELLQSLVGIGEENLLGTLISGREWP